MDKTFAVVGLTGGIASGKSTVARFMREGGVPVIDADEIAHMTMEPDGEAFGEVVARFGADIVGANGRIDREKLGAKVFDDPVCRAELEAITHPAIARLARRAFELVAKRGSPFAVYEAALLVETGSHAGLDALVVVSCSVERQMERLVARSRMTREAAAVRIAAQYPLAEKLAVADYVIDNDGALDAARAAADEVIAALRARFPAARFQVQ